MRKSYILIKVATLILVVFISFAFGRHKQAGYIFEHEKDLAKEEPGPHDGKGNTLATPFFQKLLILKLHFVNVY